MRDGVPIKVLIGLKNVSNGVVHDYPDWTKLPLERDQGGDHRDHQIVKWRYDKACGHMEEDATSPYGVQYGMMIVTRQFADEAITMFPDKVSEMAEDEATDFWENRCHQHMAENDIDTPHLQGLQAQRQLMADLGQDTTDIDVTIAKALDPTDSERGVKRNKEKTWTEAKRNLGFAMETNVKKVKG